MKTVFEKVMPYAFFYLEITGRLSCGRKVIANLPWCLNINIGFNQCMIAVDCYAATNHL